MVYRAFISHEIIESYPKCNQLIEAKVASLPADVTVTERNAERQQWIEYVFERLRMGKNYFQSHFIQLPPHGIPSTNSNCFGHLNSMWEAMALVNPDFFRRKRETIGNDDDTITLVREQLQTLVNLRRISCDLKTFSCPSSACIWRSLN